MYSSYPPILHLVAMLRQARIHTVVVCPGSRNAPVAGAFAACADFRLIPVTDERSAGFVALGLAEAMRRPVAVCCTSGTALLNLSSAAAEATYQGVPLLVISADRPAEWVDRMDGQTLRQHGALAPFVKQSFSLTEGGSLPFLLHQLRTIYLTLTAAPFGAVHVNLPIPEPLYDFSASSLPAFSCPAMLAPRLAWHTDDFAFMVRRRVLILVGQYPPDAALRHALTRLISHGAAVLAEHLSNVSDLAHAPRFDAVLADEDAASALVPDVVLTVGGHLVSKRLKRFLRTRRFSAHIALCEHAAQPYADTFDALSHVVPCADAPAFLTALADADVAFDAAYPARWQMAESRLPRAEVSASSAWTSRTAVGLLMAHLPHGASLHLANSSAVRLAQEFPLPPGVRVHANRGTNGIDGSLSAAVGNALAAADGQPTFLLIGDLSFFYDMNALALLRDLPAHLRIVLLNNAGGGIFRTLPIPQPDSATSSAATHPATPTTPTTPTTAAPDFLALFSASSAPFSASGWASSLGLTYACADTLAAFHALLPAFCAPASETSTTAPTATPTTTQILELSLPPLS